MTDSPNDLFPKRAEEDLLRSVQSILVSKERKRIQELEAEVDRLLKAEEQLDALKEHVVHLEAKLYQVERANTDQLLDIQTSVSILNYKNFGRSESLLSRLAPVFSRLIGKRIEEDKEEMAKAFSPIMGEAIRNQIRDSRQDMVDAIYPIIGASVQKSVTETLREIQRNIDERLRRTSRDWWRSSMARLRGVSSSELTLRDSMPFSLEQMFLIQHDSGLLLANYPVEEGQFSSGLIGGMLTAIRSFARDSFGQGTDETELDEIQYGDERIIISGGQFCYLAAVIRGVEPEGFHATLREFISELNLESEAALRHYDGDPDILPFMEGKLADLFEMIVADRPKMQPLSRWQVILVFLIGLGGIISLGFACFYLQFTVALYPIAFPEPTATITPSPTMTPSATATQVPDTPTPTSTHTPTPTATFTMTPSPTATTTPSHTPTSSPTFTPTATPSLTPTPTATLTPSATPTPISALMNGDVFTLSEPQLFTPRTGEVFRGTAVTITAVYDTWARIEWSDENGLQQGWVLLQWIDLRQEVPAYLVTPTTTRAP
jgi:cytoskeletal protein RodZ/predicted transcriptional regulator